MSTVDELFRTAMNLAIATGQPDNVNCLTRVGEDIAAYRSEAAIKSRPSNLYDTLTTQATVIQDGEVVIVNTINRNIRSTIHQFANQHQLQSRAAVYEDFGWERLFRCKDCKTVNTREEMKFRSDRSMDGSQSYGLSGKCSGCEDSCYHTGDDDNEDFHTWDTYNAVVLSKTTLNIPATSMLSKKQIPVSYHAKTYPIVDGAVLKSSMNTLDCAVHVSTFATAIAQLKFGPVKTK